MPATGKSPQEVIALLDALLVEVNDMNDNPEGKSSLPFEVVMNTVEAERGLTDVRAALIKVQEAITGEVERSKIPVKLCMCKGGEKDGETMDISECPIHLIDHPYHDGCCDEDEKAHRNYTRDEWHYFYPKVFDERVAVNDRTFRLDAHLHRREVREKGIHAVGVTITQIFPPTGDEEDEDDRNAGLCFDMSLDALQALNPSIQRLLTVDVSHLASEE